MAERAANFVSGSESSFSLLWGRGFVRWGELSGIATCRYYALSLAVALLIIDQPGEVRKK